MRGSDRRSDLVAEATPLWEQAFRQASLRAQKESAFDPKMEKPNGVRATSKNR